MHLNLLLIRHAKSSWANPSLGDFDRPLNDRGNHKKVEVFLECFEKLGRENCAYFQPDLCPSK